MRRAIQLVFVIGLLALPAHPATAKPKKVSNGCTAAQIQSPKASACIDKMEADIIANRPRVHAVYCSSSGRMLCCEYEGNQIVDHTCTVLGTQPPAGEGVAQPPTGVLEPSRDVVPSPAGGAAAPPAGGRAAER